MNTHPNAQPSDEAEKLKEALNRCSDSLCNENGSREQIFNGPKLHEDTTLIYAAARVHLRTLTTASLSKEQLVAARDDMSEIGGDVYYYKHQETIRALLETALAAKEQP